MEQGRMNMNEMRRLIVEDIPKEGGSFRPCAFFDSRLDCIRVVTKDCSIVEERLSDRVTMLLNNYDPTPGRRECVGFTLKGARHLCQQHSLDMKSPILLSDLLDKMLLSFPEQVVQVFIGLVVKRLVEEEKIERVEVPEMAEVA
jgi:hypothetical protein